MDPNLEHRSGGRGSSESLAGASFYSLAAQILGGAFTAVVTVFLVRTLGPDEFGLFAVAVSVAAILSVVSDLGLSQSAARFAAERTDDRSGIGEVLSATLRIKVPLALGAAIALVLSAPLIGRAMSLPAAVPALRVMGAVVFGQALLLLALTILTAVRRNLTRLRLSILEASVEASATVVLVLVSASATAAAWGRAVGFVVGGAVGLLILRRYVGGGHLLRRGAFEISTARIAKYGAALALIDGTFIIFHRLDVIVIGAVLDARAAGLFESVLRLTILIGFLGLALANGFAPRVASRSAEVPHRSGEVFEFVLRLAIVLHVGVAVSIAVWAQPIIDLLLGAAYLEATDVLRLLAWSIFLMGLAPLLSLTVNYRGHAQRRITPALVCLLLNLVIDVILIPRIGITGGAIATGVALTVYVAVHVRICRELFDLDLSALARTAGRCVIAGAGLTAVLLAIGTGELSPFDWLIGGLGGGGTYLALLYVCGEARPRDIHRLRAVLANRRVAG